MSARHLPSAAVAVELGSRDPGRDAAVSSGEVGRGAQSGAQLRADFLLVAVTLLAAMGWIFSKHALNGLPPLLFMGVRFLLAASVLGVFAVSVLRRLDLGELLAAAAPGVVMAIAMTFWILGLERAENIGVGAFICSLSVVLVPVLSCLVFGARVHRRTWAGVVVACLAMGLLFLEDGLRVSLADLFFLATAFGLALQLNLNGGLASRMPSLALTTVQLSVVGVILLGTSAGVEHWPHQISPDVVVWVLSSSLLATALRFLLLMRAQRVASPAHTALIMTLEPVWTAIIAWILLGDRMSAQQLLGCGLILVALLVSRWAPLQWMRWRGRREVTGISRPDEGR